MSYLVFARKWRPLTFDDVVGQSHITNTLKRAIEKDRVAHAYIFTGTRGTGKTTTARILARALNCDKGPTPQPCGVCESCKNIINGSSFDVLEIDGASNNGVENIRELRENVSYTSMGGKHRIFVIDEVHMLSKGAFNALLKTLEEPPKNVIFIFATTEPNKIPETIHSRCQRYDFRRISTEQILGQLDKICTRENIACEKSGLELIARRADGSMRDALSLLDQVFSFCQQKITEKEVRLVLGIVETEVFNRVLEAAAEKKPALAIAVVEDILERGFDLLEFITGLQEYLRTLLFVRLPGIQEKYRNDLLAETLSKQTDQASRFSEADLLRMIEIIRRAESDLRWSSFPRFLIETALLKLVYLDATVSVEQVISMLKTGNSPLPTVPGPITPVVDKKKADEPILKISPQATPIVVQSQITSIPKEIDTNGFTPADEKKEPVNIAEKWPSFIELMMEEKPNLGTFLSMAHIAEATSHSLDLRFTDQLQFQFAEVTKKMNRDCIQQLLNSFYGRQIDLHMTVEKSDHGHKEQNTEQAAAAPVKKNRPSLDDDIASEPIIQNVINVFKGEIV